STKSARSHVEQHVYHVTLLNRVLLALRSELSVAASFGVRAELQKLVPGDDLGADKAAFDISVDPAGRLERGGAGGDGPGMSVLLANCEECQDRKSTRLNSSHQII